MDCNLNVKDVASASDNIKIYDVESGTYRYITPESIKNYLPVFVTDLNLSGSIITVSYSDGTSKPINLP